MFLKKGLNHREDADHQNNWGNAGKTEFRGRSGLQEHQRRRQVAHRNHKVVVLRGPDIRSKIWMEHVVLALLYKVML
jgi:hypothetical protein